MPQLAQLLPLVAIALIFWLLIIRPSQRRQRDQRQMQAALSVGDEVMLTSGIYATVRSLDADVVEAEVSPGVLLTVARGAIGGLVPSGADPDGRDRRDAEGRDHDRHDPETPEDR